MKKKKTLQNDVTKCNSISSFPHPNHLQRFHLRFGFFISYVYSLLYLRRRHVFFFFLSFPITYQLSSSPSLPFQWIAIYLYIMKRRKKLPSCPVKTLIKNINFAVPFCMCTTVSYHLGLILILCFTFFLFFFL